MSLCAGRGKPETKKIRNRTAFSSVFTKSLEAEDASEFTYPRVLVSDEWLLYLVNHQNNLDRFEETNTDPQAPPQKFWFGRCGLRSKNLYF